MTETKARSFRVSDQTAESFKEIAVQIGGNQEETLSQLIKVYEMQKSKEILPERREDIAKFESYANMLVRLYLLSLEEGADAKELAKSDYEAQLYTKDEVIANLQKQLSRVETIVTDAEQNLTLLRTKAEDLSRHSDEQTAQIRKLSEERVSLKEQLSASEKEVRKLGDEKYSHQKDALAFKAEAAALKKECTSLTERCEDQASIIRDRDREIESLKKLLAEKEEHLEAEYQRGYRVAEQETSLAYRETIMQKEEDHRNALRESEEKYVTAVEKIEELHNKYVKLLEKNI